MCGCPLGSLDERREELGAACDDSPCLRQGGHGIRRNHIFCVGNLAPDNTRYIVNERRAGHGEGKLETRLRMSRHRSPREHHGRLG